VTGSSLLPDWVLTAYAPAMRLALAEAERALPSGDVPVGAVVLDPSGALLAGGHNERELTGDPTAHAEVLALRRAAAALGEWRLTGCTLVVTLEPCAMCAGAISLARVSRLVFGAWDPKAGAAGSLWDIVRDPRLNTRPEVLAGVLGDACGELLRQFFAPHREGEPLGRRTTAGREAREESPVGPCVASSPGDG